MKTIFKKEWSKEDFANVQKAITKYFKNKSFVNHRNERVNMPATFNKIEMVIGLPYTSSSSYAMMAMDCNVQLTCIEYEGFHYDHVAINEDGNIYLIVLDRDENKKLIKL